MDIRVRVANLVFGSRMKCEGHFDMTRGVSSLVVKGK